MKANKPKTLLVIALVGVVGMAFRVSWNALRDIATAIGADHTAATLYPFVVDGLMALALVATLVLEDDDRKLALKVLAGYTAASLVLNYVHGLVPALHLHTGRVSLADNTALNAVLVLLATSLPIGAIAFGSDLVGRVLRYRPAAAEVATESAPESLAPVAHDAPVREVRRSTPDQDEAQVTELAESVLGEIADLSPVAPTATTDPAPAPERKATVAESTGTARPRATRRVPDAAKPPTRPAPRSLDELLTEAREAIGDDKAVSAEKIRTTVRVGAAKARELRDLIQAERDERRHGLHAVPDDDTPDTPVDETPDEDTPDAVGGER